MPDWFFTTDRALFYPSLPKKLFEYHFSASVNQYNKVPSHQFKIVVFSVEFPIYYFLIFGNILKLNCN